MIAETLIGQLQTAINDAQAGVGGMIAPSNPLQQIDASKQRPTVEQIIGLNPKRRTRWPRR